MAPPIDVVVLSLAAFFGNFGVALTGFGMGIVYLFVWQIAALSGFDGDFKVAVFLQALSLFSVQPLLLYKADIIKHASKRMLYLFVPVTLISTPLGQYVATVVETKLVVLIGAILVTFIAVFEIYQKVRATIPLLKRRCVIVMFYSHRLTPSLPPPILAPLHLKWSFFSAYFDHACNSDSSTHAATAKKVDEHYQVVATQDKAEDVPPAHEDVEHAAGLLAIADFLKSTKFNKHKTEEEKEKDSQVALVVAEARGASAGGDIELTEVDIMLPKGSSTATTSTTTDFASTYILGKDLGAGSFSIVKEGFDKKSGSSYAIKIIERTNIAPEEEIALNSELDLLASLKHPNIMTMLDVFKEPETYFIVTEMLDGGDLLDKLSSISFFTEIAGRKIVATMLEAVAYCATQGVAHRDLKPENLLLASDKDDAIIKLADFGFAKKSSGENSFKTMCGSPSYVAPEILLKQKYNLNCDVWSVGVIAYSLLVGYQPFRGETQEVDDKKLQELIVSGTFEFDDAHGWKDVSADAKEFIKSCLVTDPKKRFTASAALNHPWFQAAIKEVKHTHKHTDDAPCFFMIGSQRSGSNWLRTMLDQREDLGCPHPPHMMREYMSILHLFGDLTIEMNYRVLCDHVCSFVERNQVPWTNKHGATITFSRTLMYNTALENVERMIETRKENKNNIPLEPGLYMLSIFDALMGFYAKSNGKRIWINKSMGMSNYHDWLLEYYGEKRLRYVYLVRDPRDVSMSFMKTPVGDCHYYAIAKKWAKLQSTACRILKEVPHLLHKVHYEAMLIDKKAAVKKIYEFIGERHFGGVKRQASVLLMKTSEDLIGSANKGREAEKAQSLSVQFMNLTRGDSFAKTQLAKWAGPEGLNNADLQMIESITYEALTYMGYKTHLVNAKDAETHLPSDAATEATVYTAQQIEEFDRLNKAGIAKMNSDLLEENPEDYERRRYQEEVLSFAKIEGGPKMLHIKRGDSFYKKGEPFLNKEQLKVRMQVVPDIDGYLADGRHFRSASATQRGYYPDLHDKPNQDRAYMQLGLAKQGHMHWFAAFDGHGSDGHFIADNAVKSVPELFAQEMLRNGNDTHKSLKFAHEQCNTDIRNNTDLLDEYSGTTAATLLLEGNKMIVSNVGDSAVILGTRCDIHKMKALQLTNTQTPLIKEELERIRASGGEVMTTDQRDGDVAISEEWNDTDKAPRVWAMGQKLPGCGFTRSIGDSFAHTIGVSATPEITEHIVDKMDHILVVCSDGVTEWLSSQVIIDFVSNFDDPAEAAAALVREATQHWIDRGDYMDDITAVVIFLDDEPGYELTFNKLVMREAKHVARENDKMESKNALKIPDDHKNFVIEATNPSQAEYDSVPLTNLAIFYTLLAGAFSGFLGGLCGIRGPPIILYFLHPPAPVQFTKKSQLATGVVITFCNVAVRVVYYFSATVDQAAKSATFESNDWNVYISVFICSIIGVLIGSEAFNHMKDSRPKIRAILSIFLLICGLSLFVTAFTKKKNGLN